jgi:hypothetical protein
MILQSLTPGLVLYFGLKQSKQKFEDENTLNATKSCSASIGELWPNPVTNKKKRCKIFPLFPAQHRINRHRCDCSIFSTIL